MDESLTKKGGEKGNGRTLQKKLYGASFICEFVVLLSTRRALLEGGGNKDRKIPLCLFLPNERGVGKTKRQTLIFPAGN